MAPEPLVQGAVLKGVRVDGTEIQVERDKQERDDKEDL